jgi:hypothetical protein
VDVRTRQLCCGRDEERAGGMCPVFCLDNRHSLPGDSALSLPPRNRALGIAGATSPGVAHRLG